MGLKNINKIPIKILTHVIDIVNITVDMVCQSRPKITVPNKSFKYLATSKEKNPIPNKLKIPIINPTVDEIIKYLFTSLLKFLFIPFDLVPLSKLCIKKTEGINKNEKIIIPKLNI